MRSVFKAMAFALVALAAACANSPDQITRDTRLNMLVADALARDNGAVVFATLGHTDMMNMAEPLVYFEVRDKPADAGNRTTMSISDDLNLAGTWAGSYSLRQVYMPANLQIYNLPGWTRGERAAVGRIDVAPGEIIYVGHLVFRAHGQTLDMVVEDRFDEFRRRLPINLINRVEKRLLVLPESMAFNSQTVTPMRR